MVKYLKAVVALFMLIPIYSQAQLELGGGLAFGTDIENLGITAKGRFDINEELKVSPSITYFFTDDAGYIKTNLFSIDGDVHYVFVLESVELYPLAGLSIGIVSVDFDTPGFDTDASDTEVGLNLGGGVRYGFTENIIGFGEIKIVVGGFDQVIITAGVLVPLN